MSELDFTETHIKDTTLAFTGHRTEKLPFGGDEKSPFVVALKTLLYSTITEHIALGFDTFIIGGAKGIDLWAGEIILEHKIQDPNIKLIAAIPYKDHGSGFKGYDKWVYCNIMQKADEIIYTSESYHKLCMKVRNQYMIDNCSKLIAVVSEFKSGTGQTIQIAKKQGVSIQVINAKDLVEMNTLDKDETELTLS